MLFPNLSTSSFQSGTIFLKMDVARKSSGAKYECLLFGKIKIQCIYAISIKKASRIDHVFTEIPL